MSPPVRARFYLDGTEVHVAEIPRFDFYTAEAQADGVGPPNEALVPGSVVRPGWRWWLRVSMDESLRRGANPSKYGRCQSLTLP